MRPPATPPAAGTTSRPAALPNLLVVGAMKCGTSALHDLLGRHPDVEMAPGKELNFLFGPDRPTSEDPAEWWREGQWHRGLAWYAAHWSPRTPVRGESSPGYTDPAHPEVPARIRATVPAARLVYLVRDPLARALSQWRHHVRDGTERRPAEEALLDPHSQYVARSRYLERIAPFLDVLPAAQLLVVVQERLLAAPDREVRRVLAHAGADPDRWPAVGGAPGGARGGGTPTHDDRTDVPARLAAAFAERVADDLAGLRAHLGDELPEWSTGASDGPGAGARADLPRG